MAVAVESLYINGKFGILFVRQKSYRTFEREDKGVPIEQKFPTVSDFFHCNGLLLDLPLVKLLIFSFECERRLKRNGAMELSVHQLSVPQMCSYICVVLIEYGGKMTLTTAQIV
jgi:hypothetical protein